MPRLAATRAGNDLRGNPIWVPLVPIIIAMGGRSMSGLAILDSGADLTIAPFESVAPLGVDWAKLPKGQPGIGAGGTFERRLCPAAITFERWRVCDDIEVAEPGRLPAVLLGRDFFAKFVIRFNWHTNVPTFDLDPIAEFKARKR